MLPKWVKLVIFYLQYLLFALIWLYSFSITFMKAKKVVKPARDKLLYCSATNLARMIRQRQVTSEEVVKTYIRRIKEVNPIINSVVEDRFEKAVTEARLVDRMIQDGNQLLDHWVKKKPLLGVPITIKESIAVAGMSQNVGMPHGHWEALGLSSRALDDMEVVTNLRTAGAVILLVSATPQLCLFLETFNSVQGTSCNPFDSRKTPGGSSGGEGALLSSAASVIGLGTDIVGSARIPALFCGVFGHKPSPGLISVKGHKPTCEDIDWDKYLTLAPMCRYAEDLPLLMAAMAPEASKILRLDQTVQIRKIRVFFMEEDGSTLTWNVDEEIKITIRKAVEHFSEVCDVQPQRIHFKEFDDVLEVVFTLMLKMKAPTNIFQRSEDPEDWTSWHVFMSFLTTAVGRSGHSMYAVMYGILQRLASLLSKSDEKAARVFKAAWQQKFKDTLGDDGVLLLPTLPRLANMHMLQYGQLTNSCYLSVFNLLEMPSTACPMGLSPKYKLPTGLQVAACKYQDKLTLAVARELETVFGGWVQPPDGNRSVLN